MPNNLRRTADRFVTIGGRGMSLDSLMEVDHVIMVNSDLTVTDDLPERHEYWLPDVNWDGSKHRVEGDGWSLLTGYKGPGMSPAEYVGGPLADDILSTPGLYVVIQPTDLSECETHCREDCSGEHVYDGWVVAHKPLDSLPESD